MNRLNLALVAIIAAAIFVSGRQPAIAGTSELCACVCAAVKTYLKPKKTPVTVPGGTVSIVTIEGSHNSGTSSNPPTTTQANTDMQDFAMEIRRCVDNNTSNGSITNLSCDCLIQPSGGGDPVTFTVDLSADVSGDPVSNTGSADIVIAVAGNESATSSSTGEDAVATNTSAGGAAIAIGGNGGGNDANPGTGGDASSNTKAGDAISVSGAGGDPSDDQNAGGTGGSATADSKGDPNLGLNGNGKSSSDGVGGTSGDPGAHGGGAWAKSGKKGPGQGSAAESGHGGARDNDSSNNNYAPAGS